MSNKQKNSPQKLPLVIIPARNEMNTVGEVVEEVYSSFNCHIVVVDDASSDDTAMRAREAGAYVLPLALQLGAWGATQTGLRYALKNNYQTVVTMDADGQHSPQSIAALLEPIYQKKADVAIGSFPIRGSWQRQLAWHFFKFISDLNLDDLTSGFRVYNKNAIALLASQGATLLDYQDVGVLLLLQKKGLIISEIETTMQPRKSGHSRIFSTWFAVLTYMLHSIILSFSRRNKPFVSHFVASLFSLPGRRP